MGIRFRCPNGHKLHVKAFLAGKRGICPHCGEKFQIPLDSDPELVKSSKHAPDAAKTAVKSSDVSAPATTEIAPEQPTPAAVDVAEPKPSGEQPVINVNVADRPTVNVTDQPAVDVSSAASTPATDQVDVAPVAQAQPSEAAEAPAEGVDPIDEAPHAVWYVRPPSGGQFGPASADVMRSWITEGRVTADSLVWREGWPEWKQAGPLFPGVTNEATPSVAAVPQIVTNAAEGSSAELYRRRKSNKSTLMVVFMLLIACLILFGALVYVVRFMN